MLEVSMCRKFLGGGTTRLKFICGNLNFNKQRLHVLINFILQLKLFLKVLHTFFCKKFKVTNFLDYIYAVHGIQEIKFGNYLHNQVILQKSYLFQNMVDNFRQSIYIF